MSAADRRKAYKLEWQRSLRKRFAEENGYSLASHYAAGGNRAAALERDGYACVVCGTTDEQHKAKWGRPITIDHKDKDRSNNSLENLQTLCLTCHALKDTAPNNIARAKVPQHKKIITKMRCEGRTYQQIGESIGLSTVAVWKWCKRWGLPDYKRGVRCATSKL